MSDSNPIPIVIEADDDYDDELAEEGEIVEEVKKMDV